ncbi:MAG: esterase/lipase family protein [Bacillota bacterium]
MYQVFTTFGLFQMLSNKFYKKAKNPIVFVPGLYGSMSDEIVPGSGEWGFGMAAPVYEPFVEKLEGLGFKKNKDLFIAFYDWRKACDGCAKQYLMEVINQAKTKCRARKVDIICHSMGGLVSRAYIQSKEYRYDVDNLIMIATPNAGAVNAYYFWSGGQLPYEKDVKANIFRALLEGYIWVLEKVYGKGNDMDTIHNSLKGAGDLIPAKKYGDFLYFLDSQKQMNFLSYDRMKWRNTFLDGLNQNADILRRRRVKVTLICGKGVETNQHLQIDKRAMHKDDRWSDGKVVGASKSKEGDGTVMMKSVLAIEGDTYIVQGSHTDILGKCMFVIGKKLNIDTDHLYRSHHESPDHYVSILIHGKGRIKIAKLRFDDTVVLYDTQNRTKDVYEEKIGDQARWIMIANEEECKLSIEYVSPYNELVDIFVVDARGEKMRIEGKELKENEVYQFIC